MFHRDHYSRGDGGLDGADGVKVCRRLTLLAGSPLLVAVAVAMLSSPSRAATARSQPAQQTPAQQPPPAQPPVEQERPDQRRPQEPTEQPAGEPGEPGQPGQPVGHLPPAPPAAPGSGAIRATYLRDCATCHGSAGRGTNLGPTLFGVGRAFTDYELSTGRMPIARSGQKVERARPAYSRTVIRALVDYVAGFGPGGPDIPHVDIEGADLARGGELYRLQCAACHAWAGDGGALVHVNAPPLQPAGPRQIAEAIRVGPGTMPVFGPGAIDPEELRDLTAYVQQLDRPDDRGGINLGHVGPLPEGAVAWVFGLGLLVFAIRWIGEK